MTTHLTAAAFVTIATLALTAQAPSPITPRPTFDVASVKANTSGEFGGSFSVRPGQVTIRNNTLQNIVRNAYRLQDFQIVGGPDWFAKDHFDIAAKAAANLPPDQLILMVQDLLADRFQLVVHIETRQLPVYALVAARNDGRLGPKLTVSAADCAGPAAGRGAPPPQPAGERPLCGTRTLPGRIMAGGVTMADLSRNLSSFAGRFVIDRTGFTGGWDLDVQWTPEPGLLPALPPNAPPLPSPDPNGPSLFTALQEQLGLRLDSQRGPVDVLVIDSAHPPSPD